jgi:DNA-binding response OmpR family regulator
MATRRLRARVVMNGLARRGLAVELAASPDPAVAAVEAAAADAILMLPETLAGPNGIDDIRRLRRVSQAPCIVVAGREDVPAQRIAALDAGADEVLHAGIPVSEAIARVRAMLRRAGRAGRAAAPEPVAPAQEGPWRLVAAGRYLAAPSGPPQRLTSAEFDLVAMLAAAAGAAVDRDAISRKVFRRPWRTDDRAVDSLVKRLRRKMPADAIHSVRGVGYAMTVAIEPAPAPVENCALHAIAPARPKNTTYSCLTNETSTRVP